MGGEEGGEVAEVDEEVAVEAGAVEALPRRPKK